MCTVPSVWMGPSLTSAIAANSTIFQPALMTIPGGTFMMGAGPRCDGNQVAVSSFQMSPLVTYRQYQEHLRSLGTRRYAAIAPDPSTGTIGVIALGESRNEVLAEIRSVFEKAGEILLASGLGVVKEQFKTLLETMPVVHLPDLGDLRSEIASRVGPDRPIMHVDWFEAFVYAFMHGGRLPYEPEWEYAMVNGHMTKIEPKPNFVIEWMQELYYNSPDATIPRPLNAPPWVNPSAYRSVRLWGGDTSLSVSRQRDGANPKDWDSNFGFRVVREQ